MDRQMDVVDSLGDEPVVGLTGFWELALGS
jgi:hypothetical protein